MFSWYMSIPRLPSSLERMTTDVDCFSCLLRLFLSSLIGTLLSVRRLLVVHNTLRPPCRKYSVQCVLLIQSGSMLPEHQLLTLPDYIVVPPGAEGTRERSLFVSMQSDRACSEESNDE